MLRRSLVLVLLMLLPNIASAAPRDELVGYWKLRRGEGGPCASQIRSLSYYFGRDGKYRGEAEMIPQGSYKYSGTYQATDLAATAYVDGTALGPYPYRIEKNLLFIDQPQYRCRVVMEREDY